MANNQFQSLGKSSLGQAAIKSALGQAAKKAGSLWVMTRAASAGLPHPIYEINTDGTIKHSGTGPNDPGTLYGSYLGSDGKRLWYTNPDAGVICELKTTDFSVKSTFAVPAAGTPKEMAITAHGDFVYFAEFNLTLSSITLYKLNAGDMSVAASLDILHNPPATGPFGLGANGTSLWMGGQEKIHKFDLNLNFISSIATSVFDAANLGSSADFIALDGLDAKVRVVKRGLLDMRIFELNMNTSVETDIVTLDAGITGALVSTAGGK